MFVKKTENANILCEHLPKREGKEGLKKEARLRQILRKNLTEYQAEDEHFIGTFKNALTEIKAIPPKESHDLIKNRAEKIDIATLESIVIRYHEPFKSMFYLRKLTLICQIIKFLRKKKTKTILKCWQIVIIFNFFLKVYDCKRYNKGDIFMQC